MSILACEWNNSNLLVQRNYFQSSIASLQKCPANMQQIYRRRPIQKCDFKKCCVAHLNGCSIVNLLGICRTSFLKSTSGELVLCFISFVLMHVKNNIFHWLAFIIYRPEFEDLLKTFLKVFLVLCYIFRNDFSNSWCNWSKYNFKQLFQSNVQRNVLCNCRSSPLQVLFKKDHLIYTHYKYEEE